MLELNIDFDNLDPGTIELSEARGVCHFSGYLARKIQKMLQCHGCFNLLVTEKEMPSFKLGRHLQDTLPDYHNYTRLQDCGELLYPSNHCLHLTMLGLELFWTIINEPETRLQFFCLSRSKIDKWHSTMCRESPLSHFWKKRRLKSQQYSIWLFWKKGCKKD